MPSIRIWTLESDNDAKAVKRLADELTKYLRLEGISIETTGKIKHPVRVREAVRNFLKDEDCVIFVIDRDGPMALHERSRQTDSHLTEIRRIVNERSLKGKVFLVEAVHELEAWLLIDCLGIFCFYATKRAAHLRENCRDKVLVNMNFKRLVDRYQKGNTESIVEAEQGGSGPKEYLTEFSAKVLKELNPNLTERSIDREKYQGRISPEVAEYIEINRETLRRNNSLKKLGDVIELFQ